MANYAFAYCQPVLDLPSMKLTVASPSTLAQPCGKTRLLTDDRTPKTAGAPTDLSNAVATQGPPPSSPNNQTSLKQRISLPNYWQTGRTIGRQNELLTDRIPLSSQPETSPP